MENNKKSQNYSRLVNNSKTSQSFDSKRKGDLQVAKSLPRFSRRREQPNIGRDEQSYRNTKQLPAKQRPNVDKRPRARGCSSNTGSGELDNCLGVHNSTDCSSNNDEIVLPSENDPTCFPDDIYVACSGLADVDSADNYENSYNAVKNESLKALNKCNAASSYLSFGGRKQNLNHLLNFQYTRRGYDYDMNVFGRNRGYHHSHNGHSGNLGKRHKYNKEQFLQANFQFVVKSSAKLSLTDSPDRIIDWDLIEQINIQTTEEPQCPICLYPPIAAKLTRCGHAYCWPCILHYLALNDKTWRKCPICYEAVHVRDLKSTTILQQRQFSVDEIITFQLMRRKKGSLFVEKVSGANASSVERYPLFSSNDDIKNFSKFLIAKRNDVVHIIERERRELEDDQDTTCPEYVFVQQALELLNDRFERICDAGDGKKFVESNKPIGYESEEKNPTMPVVLEALDADIIPTELHINLDFTDDADSEESSAHANFPEQQTLPNSADPTIKYYYFYQSSDGQNIFLHPLNAKMLQACYGSLNSAPLSVNARILQREYHTMDEDLRRKFTCLSHLPLTCQFSVVEVELKIPIVTKDILKLFQDDIKNRQSERERRDREEKKREKKIAAINDKQMGKIINSYANLDLRSSHEFPTFGFSDGIGEFATDLEELNGKPSEMSPNVAPSVPSTGSGLSYSSVISSQDFSPTTGTLKNNFPELGGKPLRNHTPFRHAETPLTPVKLMNPMSTHSSAAVNSLDYDDDFNDGTVKAMGATFGDVFELAVMAKNNKKNKVKTRDNKLGLPTKNGASLACSDQTLINDKIKTKKGKKKFTHMDAGEFFS